MTDSIFSRPPIPEDVYEEARQIVAKFDGTGVSLNNPVIRFAKELLRLRSAPQPTLERKEETL